MLDPSSVLSWLKVLGLLIPLAGASGLGAVKLLGVETEEAHDADIDRIEAVLSNQTIMLQCLLWEVPAIKCLNSQE